MPATASIVFVPTFIAASTYPNFMSDTGQWAEAGTEKMQDFFRDF
jgi:hypothetical protein